MQLSKSEYTYRYKLIYENHFNKAQQKQLDEVISSNGDTYKAVYTSCRDGNTPPFITMMRITQPFQMLSMSLQEVSEAFSQIGNASVAYSDAIGMFEKACRVAS